MLATSVNRVTLVRVTTLDERLLPVHASVTAASCWRWYCLLIVAGISSLQGGYWSNFGPISIPAEAYFGWKDADIALLANWGPIMYFIAAAPFAWMLDVTGLRASAIVASALIFGGAICRIVHVQPDELGSHLMHAGQILNALAGPVAMSAGPVLSAMWFPPSERTFATAVVATSNYGGTCFMFALGPLLVPSGLTSEETGAALRTYMIGEAIVAGALFAGALCFPTMPKELPSRSAGLARMAIGSGLVQLLRLPAFWALAMSYSVSSGVFQAWGSQLGPNMKAVLPADEAESQAGLMGFGGALAGIVGGVALSAFSDRGRGRKKMLLIALMVVAAACALAFALLCTEYIPDSWLLLEKEARTVNAEARTVNSEARTVNADQSDSTKKAGSVSPARMAALYATSIITALCINAAAPIFFESSVEAAYPVGEGLVTIVATVLSNLGCLFFLMAPSITPNTKWMNWTLVAVCVLSLLLVCPIAEPRGRLQLDMDEAPRIS